VACQSQRLLPNDILSIAKLRYRIVYSPPGEESPLDKDSDPYGFGGSLLEKAGIVLNSPEKSASQQAPASGAALTAFGELVPCGGGSPIPLLKPKLLVGRHPGCDVPLPFPTVSSRHCELEFRDGFWFVHDLGSSNGVRVDGERCESQRLMPHNVLSISTHRYRLSYRPREDDPLPHDAAARPFGRGLLEKAGLLRRRTEPLARPTPSPPNRDQLPDWLVQDDEDDQRPRYRLDEDL